MKARRLGVALLVVLLWGASASARVLLTTSFEPPEAPSDAADPGAVGAAGTQPAVPALPPVPRHELVGWRPVSLWDDQTGELALAEDQPRTGVRSLRLWNVTTRLAFVSDALRIDPLEQLRLTGWIRTQYALRGARLVLSFFDERQQGIVETESAPVVGDSEYTRVAVRTTPPDGAAWVMVACVMDGPGVAWFDDLRLSSSQAEPVWLMDVLSAEVGQPGQTLPVQISVQATRPITEDDTVRIELVPVSGDAEGFGGTFHPSPVSSQWPERRSVTLGPMPIEVPPYQPHGEYRMVVSLGRLGLLYHKRPPHITVTQAKRALPETAGVHVRLDAPGRATAGRVIEARIGCLFAELPSGPVHGFLSLLDVSGELLYDEVGFEIPLGATDADPDQSVSVYLGVNRELPAGQYLLRAGLCGPYAVGGAAESPLAVESAALGSGPVPMAHGSFVDSSAVRHRWTVGRDGLLTWDGAPWVPVGGVVATAFFTAYFPGDEELNRKSLRAFESRLDTLKDAGLLDVTFEPAGDLLDRPAHVLQRVLDALEARGFRYGISIGGAADEGYRAYRIDERLVLRGAAGGEPASIALNYPPPRDGRALVVARDSATGAVAHIGLEAIRIPLGVDAAGGTVTFTVGRKGDGRSYDVFVTPESIVPSGEGVGDIWSNFDRRRARLLGHLSEVSYGPGLRFFVSPLCHDLSTSRSRDLPGTGTGMPEAFAEWLRGRYGDLEALARAWCAEPEPPSFDAAARLVPATHGAATTVMVDPVTMKALTVRSGDTLFARDLEEFREESVARCLDILCADIRALVADVPIVVEHQWASRRYFTATDPRGGPDGVAMRSFGAAAELGVSDAAVTAGEASLGQHTLWCIASQTAPTAGREARSTGYADAASMAAAFDVLLGCGARGLFALGASLDGIAGYVAHDLARQPEQLGWIAEYRSLVEKRVGALRQPRFVYVYPPAQRAPLLLQLGPSSPFGLDGSLAGTPARLLPDGRWLVPSPSVGGRPGDYVVSLADFPRSASAIHELRALLSRPDARVVLVGPYRAAPGDLPQIAGWYGPVPDTSVAGEWVQPLRPPPGAEVLATADDGSVWHMRRANMEAISRWPIDLDWVLAHSVLLGATR